MVKIFLAAFISVIVIGGYLISKGPAPVSPAPASPAPAAKQPPCEPMQYALTRIFAAKAYQDLANCLAPSVRYSRFESSDSRQLTPAQTVAEITSLTTGVQAWTTNPDDPVVKKLRANHINAWSEAYFALADNKTGFAFNLNREGQIQTVVLMTNYPALAR